MLGGQNRHVNPLDSLSASNYDEGMTYQYGILNLDMFGTPSEPGEHVDWSVPDYFDAETILDICGMSPEEYAETSPHMLVFEASGL